MRTASRTPASDGLVRAALALALGAALAGAAAHLRPAAPAVTRGPSATAATARAPLPRRARAVVPAAFITPQPDAVASLPGALQGTSEDGALREDEQGGLVIGPEILRLFDYYLSASGQESAAALRARIVAAIHRQLGDRPAARAAVDLLDRYLAYRADAPRLVPAGSDLDARLEGLRRLRRERFGDLAEGLFGDEERAAAVALEQRRALLDGSLSPEDRERRLDALEGDLPEAARRARAAATEPLREAAEEAALLRAGAGEDDLRAYRTATAGAEAADRLAELDRRRAAWKARVDAFRAARAALASSEPDPDRRSAATARLLARSFSPLEQIRVDAADRLDAESP
jgi:lipase chaperone LimK